MAEQSGAEGWGQPLEPQHLSRVSLRHWGLFRLLPAYRCQAASWPHEPTSATAPGARSWAPARAPAQDGARRGGGPLGGPVCHSGLHPPPGGSQRLQSESHWADVGRGVQTHMPIGWIWVPGLGAEQMPRAAEGSFPATLPGPGPRGSWLRLPGQGGLWVRIPAGCSLAV